MDKKKLIKYLVTGVAARIGLQVYANETFEQKIGRKFEDNYFKNYNFKRFIDDAIYVVTWPITTPICLIGGKRIDSMSDEEFFEEYPEYKKYREENEEGS